MAISKLLDRQGNIIIDLSNDTVTPETVAEGKTFHDAFGNVQIGTGNAIETEDSDWDIHNNFYFIDYDGKLLYKYSMQELQNLTELPVPNVEHENLTFDEWNWTLEDLKNESAGIIVGANYHTTDGRDHMKVKVNEDGKSITLPVFTLTGTESVTLDWGDGTTSTLEANPTGGAGSHTYTTAGIYDISIVNQNDNMSFLYSGDSPWHFGDEYIYPLEINLHTNTILGNVRVEFYYNEVLKMSIPSSINMSSIKGSTFYVFNNIIALVLPRTITNINYPYFLQACYLLKLLSIPKLTETSISESYLFAYCNSLKYLTIPDGVENISMEYNLYGLKYVRFPSTLKTCNFNSNIYLKKIILPEGTTSCNLYPDYAEYVIIPSTCTLGNYSFNAVKYLDIGNASSDININGNTDVLINRTSYGINTYREPGGCIPKYYRADYRFNTDESRIYPSETLDFSNWKSSEAPYIYDNYNAIYITDEILVPANKYEEWRVLNDYWKKLDRLGKLKAV